MLVVPRSAAEFIRTSGAHGEFNTSTDTDLAYGAVSAIGSGPRALLLPTPLPKLHPLLHASRGLQGHWRRAALDLHGLWHAVRGRGGALAIEAAAELVEQPLPATGNTAYFLITYAPKPPTDDGADEPHARWGELQAWLVGAGRLTPIDIDVEPDELGPVRLMPQWPTDLLSDKRVVLVGTGSIGSALAHELARAGVGMIDLADPGRLRWHNLVRHTLGPRDVGRYKVEALAAQLHERWPDTTVRDFPLSVIAHADLMRPLLDQASVVVCAADGIASRRVVSHLARRAGKTAVLACVHMDGELGEVLRLRPRRSEGCLLCRREHDQQTQALDLEAGIDLDYGTGQQHRPMTTVGSDLTLVAALAAKVTLATLLQEAGRGEHRLAGEHVVVRLRGGLPHRPPFHGENVLDVVWSPATAPRPDCPTCQQ